MVTSDALLGCVRDICGRNRRGSLSSNWKHHSSTAVEDSQTTAFSSDSTCSPGFSNICNVAERRVWRVSAVRIH